VTSSAIDAGEAFTRCDGFSPGGVSSADGARVKALEVSTAVALASLSGIGFRAADAEVSSVSTPEDGGTGVEDDMWSALLALGDFVRVGTGEASRSMGETTAPMTLSSGGLLSLRNCVSVSLLASSSEREATLNRSMFTAATSARKARNRIEPSANLALSVRSLKIDISPALRPY